MIKPECLWSLPGCNTAVLLGEGRDLDGGRVFEGGAADFGHSRDGRATPPFPALDGGA